MNQSNEGAVSMKPIAGSFILVESEQTRWLAWVRTASPRPKPQRQAEQMGAIHTNEGGRWYGSVTRDSALFANYLFEGPHFAPPSNSAGDRRWPATASLLRRPCRRARPDGVSSRCLGVAGGTTTRLRREVVCDWTRSPTEYSESR
jgi:hypothetical protein